MAHIWYISKYAAPPGFTRVGTRGFLILREFARRGHKPLLITSDSNHLANPPKLETPVKSEQIDDVDVVWLRTRKYQGARSMGRILSWFDFEWQLLCLPKRDLARPDVVIVSSLSLLTVLSGLLLRRRYGCKLVFEVRDIWPLVLTAAGGFGPRHPAVLFLAWVEKLGYRRADLIVGTMPNLREHVVEVSGANKPVVCIPQGIEPTLLDDPAPLPNGYREFYIPKDKFIVCHAGSLGADNALETFLSCARAMKERPDIYFLLIGEGHLKAALQTSVQDLPNVGFAPGIPKAAVQSALQHANLLYFGTHKSPLMRFGQSLNKVIDYMLSGKPILASFTGYPTMINEADCGSYVPAEDAEALRQEIERYAAMDASERQRLGQRGRDWVLKHRRYDLLAQAYLSDLGLDGR